MLDSNVSKMSLSPCSVGWPKSVPAESHERLTDDIQAKKDEILREMVKNLSSASMDALKYTYLERPVGYRLIDYLLRDVLTDRLC